MPSDGPTTSMPTSDPSMQPTTDMPSNLPTNVSIKTFMSCVSLFISRLILIWCIITAPDIISNWIPEPDSYIGELLSYFRQSWYSITNHFSPLDCIALFTFRSRHLLLQLNHQPHLLFRYLFALLTSSFVMERIVLANSTCRATLLDLVKVVLFSTLPSLLVPRLQVMVPLLLQLLMMLVASAAEVRLVR